MDAIKTALGGVPGQIGVMVNGEYVKFPDAVPEVTGGRTMVPVRAIVEALGGEADMAGGKVTCKANNTSLTFTPGSSEVLVEYTGGELPGDGQIFPMDCAPYIKGGRTYVPVRFVAEAWGCAVGWDADTSTVVIVDVDTLLGNATFDLMDSFAAYCAKQEKNRNDSRIRYLQRMVSTAKVISTDSGEDTVGLFDKVVAFHEKLGREMTLRIVTTLRSDAGKGLISKESPVGKAILGRKAGDRVHVKVSNDVQYDMVIRSIEKGEDDESLEIRQY